MKIVLINLPHEESLDPLLDPPLGLMYIASVIRKLNKEYEVSIMDLSFHNRKEWINIIPFADLYGITVMTSSLHHSLNVKNICKKINPECKVMVGGAHPSALPRKTLRLGFDIVVVGEAEGTVEHILKYVSQPDSQYPTMIYGNNRLIDINKIPYPSLVL